MCRAAGRGVFLILFLAGGAFAGENWPQLLGPTGDGHSDAKGLPLTWSETENIVWKTPLHDAGWSSPVIWGNQIWLTTATGDGKQSFGLCLDKESGKILFDQKLFDNEKPEETRKYNSFASPTPVIEEGRVFLHFGSYGTACIDTKTFKTLWTRRDLPCLHWRGPASSPILFENLMIVHYDGHDHQYVAALNKLTGDTVWKTIRDVDYGTKDGDVMKAFSTPTVFELEGRPQLISPTSKAVLSYDPRTGKEIWRLRFKEFSVAARPLLGHGLLFINTGFGRANLLGVKTTGLKGDVTDTHVVWRADKSIGSKPTELLVGDLVFSIHDSGTALCLDAKTGKELWLERLGGDYSATPLYADGRIYCFSHQGTTTVFAPERTYKKLATNKLDGGCRASPAVSGKALFVRTEIPSGESGFLYRIEQKSP